MLSRSIPSVSQAQPPSQWSLECPIVYGPIRSRRYGFSLGINLLPSGWKLCNFDCLYCQCGWTGRSRFRDSFAAVPFPLLEEVERTVDRIFRELGQARVQPDTIVFSGNGEPTLHPGFPEAARLVEAYRDQYLPETQIGILTNGTRILVAGVGDAIARMEFKSFKLDAGLDWMNRPLGSHPLEPLLPAWSQIPDLTIQSFFCEGRFDNTLSQVVAPWVERLCRIKPRRVHLYTLDRLPASTLIQKASLTSLTRAARAVVNATGIEVDVFD